MSPIRFTFILFFSFTGMNVEMNSIQPLLTTIVDSKQNWSRPESSPWAQVTFPTILACWPNFVASKFNYCRYKNEPSAKEYQRMRVNKGKKDTIMKRLSKLWALLSIIYKWTLSNCSKPLLWALMTLIETRIVIINQKWLFLSFIYVDQII